MMMFPLLSFVTDTFQALIQYPDVVTAQAAKLVRPIKENSARILVFSARFFFFSSCCVIDDVIYFLSRRHWMVRTYTTHAARYA